MERLSIEQIQKAPDVLEACVQILWQLADDDMVIGFRDQEWLGLAPHIEEDVAFGSIGQEEIGHAAHYYGLLEKFGLGKADDLASLRGSLERHNAILLEQPNGSGTYLQDPHFDWAWTIVRHYYHDLWEMTCLSALRDSIFGEIGDAARKILAEKRYHRAHQELWIRTMVDRGGEPKTKLMAALAHVSEWAWDLPSFGSAGTALEETGVLPGANTLAGSFWQELEGFFGSLGVSVPTSDQKDLNGRLGQHTDKLDEVLSTWSEVYRLDPQAQW